MGRAFCGSNMPHWIRNNILDFLRAMSVKKRQKKERYATRRRWERDCRELVRFGLLMRRIALSRISTRRKMSRRKNFLFSHWLLEPVAAENSSSEK